MLRGHLCILVLELGCLSVFWVVIEDNDTSQTPQAFGKNSPANDLFAVGSPYCSVGE